MSELLKELDKLRIFVVVARKGKINDASDILNLSQPSITRAIQKLEEAFGAALFIRNRDGVTLTKAGELLNVKAVRILRDLEDIQVRARHIDHDYSGILTVGTYESLAEYLWPDFLISLQKIHPHLQLSVRTSQFHDPMQSLLMENIDLLVDAEPLVKDAVISWPLYSDKFGFYIAPTHSGGPKDQDWAKGISILYVRQAFDEDRMTIENHLKNAHYSFSREYCFDSFSTIKRLAIRGMGLAVLPRRLAEEDEKKNRLKSISLNGFSAGGFGKHTVCATVAAKNEKEPRLRRVISLLKNHLR